MLKNHRPPHGAPGPPRHDTATPAADSQRGRHGRPWRTVKARVYTEETDCWWCGAWVDQTLDRRHPHSRSVDHLVQLQHGGDPLNRGNLHLAHRTCNVTRSNRLRGLPQQLCACSRGPGHPCARLDRPTPQPAPAATYLSVDPRTI